MEKIIKKPKHSFLAMIFHWGFVVIFTYGIVKQVDNINQLSDMALLKFEIIFAAKTTRVLKTEKPATCRLF